MKRYVKASIDDGEVKKIYSSSFKYSNSDLVKKSELAQYLPYISISETDAYRIWNVSDKPVNIIHKTKSGGLTITKCKLDVDWDDWQLPFVDENAKDGDTLKVYVHSKYTAIFVCTERAEWGKVYYVPGTHYIPIKDAITYIADMYNIENCLYHKGSKYYKIDV